MRDVHEVEEKKLHDACSILITLVQEEFYKAVDF